jgi:hypothetical protein
MVLWVVARLVVEVKDTEFQKILKTEEKDCVCRATQNLTFRNLPKHANELLPSP